MITGIVRRLESIGDTDIKSEIIGKIVMETLSRIDTVAYVRFASVYKNFQELGDFEDFYVRTTLRAKLNQRRRIRESHTFLQKIRNF